MAETGDIFHEFKTAKPPEKIFLIAGGIGVVAILLYLHNQSGGQAQSQTNQPAPTAGGGIQTVPGPNNSQIPLLPTGQGGGPGYTPIFDQLGNLIGYQPVMPPGQVAPPTPTPTPGPKPSKLPGRGGRDRDRHKPRGAHQTSPVSVPTTQNMGTRPIVHGIHGGPPSRVNPPTTGATAGGVVSGGMPSIRPQRANPTLQSSVVTRTAAQTRLRGH